VVHAQGDVKVRADSEENILSISAAAGIGGTAGVGASISTWTVLPTTRAYIGTFAQVYTVGNVLVAADDKDGLSIIAGTVTGSGGGSVGASVGVPVVEKTTESYISANANVNALGADGGTGINADTGGYSVVYGSRTFDPSTKVSTSDGSIDLGYNHG